MVWARMLAYITGTVDQELLVRNEYLAAENRILKAQIKGRLLLSEADKATLAEIAYRLGRKALEEVAAAAKPDTILGWYRKLIANKFDGSRFRGSAGRPRVEEETERLVVQMAKENPPGAMIASWVPWPILASGYRTRRWATSCVATESLLPPNESTRPAGRISSALIWMFWWERISLRWKCLRSKGWLPTTYCSLSSWRVGGFVWPESRLIGPAVDGTDGAQRDHAKVGVPGQRPISTA